MPRHTRKKDNNKPKGRKRPRAWHRKAERSILSCENSGYEPSYHFVEVTNMIETDEKLAQKMGVEA